MTTPAHVVSTGSATFKARDVEELIDFYLHRRAANVLLRLIAPTPLTPNQVTVLSGLTAIVAGLLVGTAGAGRPWQAVLGGVVFFLSIVLDCVDGQLARLRKTSSFAGRALDGYTDVVSIAAIMLGQMGWLLSHGCPLWVTQVVGWSTGLSFQWHAHNYDHIKNVYLYNTQAHAPGEIPSFPNMDEIERERAEHERAGRWFSELLVRGFRNFTEGQRRGITDRSGVDQRGMETAPEREQYRARFRIFMRLWSFNGVGSHLFVFTLATLFSPVFPFAPLLAWAFVSLPMNLFTLALKIAEPKLEARLKADLAAL